MAILGIHTQRRNRVLVPTKNADQFIGICHIEGSEKMVKKNYIISEVTRKKMSDAKIGKHLSEEHKKNISNSLKGERSPWFGKHLLEETRKKLSESNKGKHSGKEHPFFGKHLTEETRKKISNTLKGNVPWIKGKHHSEESRKKMREIFKGRPCPMKGKKHSQESRKKMSESKKGKKRNIILSQETKDKLRAGRLGKYHTEETKLKISQNRIGKAVGEKNTNYRRIFPIEYREKIEKNYKQEWLSK